MWKLARAERLHPLASTAASGGSLCPGSASRLTDSVRVCTRSLLLCMTVSNPGDCSRQASSCSPGISDGTTSLMSPVGSRDVYHQLTWEAP